MDKPLREALLTIRAMAKATPYRPDSTIENILAVANAALKNEDNGTR